jgi:hypothetical protein
MGGWNKSATSDQAISYQPSAFSYQPSAPRNGVLHLRTLSIGRLLCYIIRFKPEVNHIVLKKGE